MRSLSRGVCPASSPSSGGALRGEAPPKCDRRKLKLCRMMPFRTSIIHWGEMYTLLFMSSDTRSSPLCASADVGEAGRGGCLSALLYFSQVPKYRSFPVSCMYVVAILSVTPDRPFAAAILSYSPHGMMGTPLSRLILISSSTSIQDLGMISPYHLMSCAASITPLRSASTPVPSVLLILKLSAPLRAVTASPMRPTSRLVVRIFSSTVFCTYSTCMSRLSWLATVSTCVHTSMMLTPGTRCCSMSIH
mmetsp:Transcript_47999/g.116578  ORF Transcript_47999/g.116578 Transcript_47999/m.116578 type:complete len:248 (-) Transcript_47999:220-963(-)